MGKGKERDGISPAEAYRKQQRKKELEKNKRQREAAREVKALQHADLYQKRLVDSPAGGGSAGAPALKKARPAVPPAPVAAAPASPAATAKPTGPTEIVLGTGGLMPTSLRVRRNVKPVKQCAPAAPAPPQPPQPVPQPQKDSDATDELARFEEEMKQLGAL